MYTIIIGVIFILLSILTIWAQLPNSFILRYNNFGFIQYCRFFSPNPVSKDIKVYYRILSSDSKDDDISEDEIWNLLKIPKNNKYSFIWSPEKKIQKAINTLTRNLIFISKKYDNVEFSVPYLILLNVIQSNLTRVHKSSQDMIQFIITRHSGFKSDFRECIFISQKHPID